jgi:hypothetical protein
MLRLAQPIPMYPYLYSTWNVAYYLLASIESEETWLRVGFKFRVELKDLNNLLLGTIAKRGMYESRHYYESYL